MVRFPRFAIFFEFETEPTLVIGDHLGSVKTRLLSTLLSKYPKGLFKRSNGLENPLFNGVKWGGWGSNPRPTDYEDGLSV